MSQRRANRKSRKKDEPEEKEEPPVEEEPELITESRHFVVTTFTPANIEEMTDFLMRMKNVELVKATGPGMEEAIDMAKAELKVEIGNKITDGAAKLVARTLG